MNIAISGATGFIGKALVKKLKESGWEVYEIDRPSFGLSPKDFGEKWVEGMDVIIHLSGAPVSKKWTIPYKEEIYKSRIATTKTITAAIRSVKQPPSLFISTSAIGIYNSSGTHTESEYSYADTFLAHVCNDWETAAREVQDLSRVVIFRLGMVLSSEGGILKKMGPFFQIGLGGKIGDGKQYISFIHLNDLLNVYLFVINNPSLSGAVNVVTPFPVTHSEFTETLGKVLKQPVPFTVPSFMIKKVLGEGAQILLEGQKVFPEKLQQAGFHYIYPLLRNALIRIY
ncbi:MAG: TIGR01777 family oxidoreductase [Bacteroidales bacterium]|nr:TIGR01777 family oxidoreductase [Bacteroidales bacterium]MDD4602265.1 TIGR01777 family oxidoreductase [Bacteroidales bacterium]